MKLEVGMLARNEHGIFFQIEEVLGKSYVAGLCNSVIDVYGQMLITKASHNIIDLIEVGDYVNGYRVALVENGIIYWDSEHTGALSVLVSIAKEIKSIVTHEQFAQSEYKVGGGE